MSSTDNPLDKAKRLMQQTLRAISASDNVTSEDKAELCEFEAYILRFESPKAKGKAIAEQASA